MHATVGHLVDFMYLGKRGCPPRHWRVLPVAIYEREQHRSLEGLIAGASQTVILDRFRVLSRDNPVFFARSW
jgi:hypothetical protein